MYEEDSKQQKLHMQRPFGDKDQGTHQKSLEMDEVLKVWGLETDGANTSMYVYLIDC